MKLNQLRQFIAVAQRGNIRSAARHLACAQPAITRSIHEIERDLGTALFERTAKGMVLTSAGELFLRRARPDLLLPQPLLSMPHRHVVNDKDVLEEMHGGH